MDFTTYFLIFVLKIIETTLGTLRLIVVANGKKWFGAILQGVIAVIWVLSAGIVIVNINDDPLKIVFFALGSLVGSYIGSLIEEKIALGSSMITAIIDEKKAQLITRTLRKQKYIINTNYINNDKTKTIIIMVHRKRIQRVAKIIKTIDNKAIIVAHNINPIVLW
ncbi:MAG: DUF5698 domain-containing protein [Bacilli bacterium]